MKKKNKNNNSDNNIDNKKIDDRVVVCPNPHEVHRMQLWCTFILHHRINVEKKIQFNYYCY